MSQEIIIPFDGSLNSRNSLQFAITMARAYGDQIRLLNIQPNLQILGESMIAEASSILEEAQIPYSAKIRIGTPSIEVTTEARNEKVRCIVIGSKGAGNSEKPLGSVTQAILTTSPCPVVIVPYS